MVNKLSDVQIILDVQKPAAPVRLGQLAIFTPGEALGYETYTAMDEMQEAITDKQVLQVAKGFFDQDEHYKELAVCTYTDLTAALDEYFESGWEFATLAGDKLVPGTTEEDGTLTTADAYQTMSNYIEIKKRCFFVDGTKADKDTVTDSEKLTKKYDANDRTIFFASGTDTDEAEYGIGALIGQLANQLVGSITWKFKTLNGVKPTDFTASQVNRLHKNGIFTYVSKAGIEQTSEGITVSGEFIDAIHGDDWVKAKMEAELQNLLSTSKKVAYDTAGIAQIAAVANQVLTQATSNGIILWKEDGSAGEFTVHTVSRNDTDVQDVVAREYKGMDFTYRRSGAIHTIVVHGTVTM